MYFTREPIIETIISPRDGYKLILRSSKHERQDEYSVDSVEVISFGNHCFYRSLDRGETFLLPVFDYEVIEARTTRLALKSGSMQDKEIKIGKAKEAKPNQEEKKKDKRLLRKRKEQERASRIEEESDVIEEEPVPFLEKPEEVKPVERESIARIMIPPPTSLISDTLSRYQQIKPTVEEAVAEEEMKEEEEEVDFLDDEPL